jgi:hypothetical protein
MPKKSECWGIICAAVLAAPLPNAAFAADALIDAIAGGKVSGNFRLRYEDVEVKSLTVEDATALTLRSRLGYETAPFQGFTAILEFEDTHTVGGKDEYSPEHKNPAKPATAPYDYAAIVDPERTEINRAYLRYRGVPKLDMGLGRQRIVLDNQRFVGSVSWRQDEQTFDAFTAKYDGVADWSFYYAYVDKVNGIASVEPTYNFDIDSSDNLFNITYSGFTLGKLTAYGYFLDNQEPLTALLNLAPDINALNPTLRYQSIDTYGLRFDGVYIRGIREAGIHQRDRCRVRYRLFVYRGRCRLCEQGRHVVGESRAGSAGLGYGRRGNAGLSNAVRHQACVQWLGRYVPEYTDRGLEGSLRHARGGLAAVRREADGDVPQVQRTGWSADRRRCA